MREIRRETAKETRKDCASRVGTWRTREICNGVELKFPLATTADRSRLRPDFARRGLVQELECPAFAFRALPAGNRFRELAERIDRDERY